MPLSHGSSGTTKKFRPGTHILLMQMSWQQPRTVSRARTWAFSRSAATLVRRDHALYSPTQSFWTHWTRRNLRRSTRFCCVWLRRLIKRATVSGLAASSSQTFLRALALDSISLET